MRAPVSLRARLALRSETPRPRFAILPRAPFAPFTPLVPSPPLQATTPTNITTEVLGIRMPRRYAAPEGGPLAADPAAALDHRSGLVQGRWSLVDYWDRDGRRFFAAHPNAPGVLDPPALEREGGALALIDGASLMEIAYSLGISAGNACSSTAPAKARGREPGPRSTVHRDRSGSVIRLYA